MSEHRCHWPGCGQKVKPSLWGCRPHWMRLPKVIRHGIAATYRRGQELDKNPSRAYLKAAQLAQFWIQQAGRRGAV